MRQTTCGVKSVDFIRRLCTNLSAQYGRCYAHRYGNPSRTFKRAMQALSATVERGERGSGCVPFVRISTSRTASKPRFNIPELLKKLLTNSSIADFNKPAEPSHNPA